MESTGPWYCDTCDGVISEPTGGNVVFGTQQGPDGLRYHDFRLVHKGECDPRSLTMSVEISDLLGVDGLTNLLSFFSDGPLKLRYALDDGPRPSKLADVDQFVDVVRRVQTPGYERLRRIFDDPDLQAAVTDQHEYAPYMQASIHQLLEAFEPPER